MARGVHGDRANDNTVNARAQTAVGLAVVVGTALLSRLPPFLNAGAVNSDAAVVGLQAIALLERGEHAVHLWGTNYQTIVDVVVAAGLFKVLGPSPWALFAMPWLGAAAVCALVYLMLHRSMGATNAVIAALTVSFGSQAITSPMTYVLRQMMFLIIVLGLWLVHRASKGGLGPLQLFLGAVCFGLGIFTDVFATIMWPACALFALAACVDAPFSWKVFGLRAGATVAGLGLGLVPAKLVGHIGGGATPGLTLDRWKANWPLFSEQCFPYAISTKVWIPGTNLYPDLWQPPAPFHWLQLAGAALLGLLWLSALALAFVKRIDWPARRLGLFGVAAGSANLIGFLLSTAPADMWSVRYLAPLMWTVPFALAPLAALLRAQGLAVLLAPYLVSAAVSGWLSWGTFVKGPLPVQTARGAANEEAQVITELQRRGVEAAAAQYWLAYRFTLLSAEKLVTVPIDGGDRYPAYRAKFDGARKVALIFHPSEPRAQPQPYEANLQTQRLAYETVRIADFTVFVIDRAQRPGP